MNQSRNRKLCKVKQLKLWDIHVTMGWWKRLIEKMENIKMFYLWNMIITDEDIDDILQNNDLKALEGIRIGASEIGYVRLTDESVMKIVRKCHNIKSIGGICDWKIRDLLSLLQNLLANGGWRIMLETNQSSINF